MDQEEAMFGKEIKPKKKPNYTKMFALGLGGLIGLSHIGMIGTLMNSCLLYTSDAADE